MATESPREDLVAAEAKLRRNQSHLPAARQEFVCGALESQPKRVLLRRLPEQRAKGAVEVEGGPSCPVGQRAQIGGLAADVLNDRKEFLSAHSHMIVPADWGA